MGRATSPGFSPVKRFTYTCRTRTGPLTACSCALCSQVRTHDLQDVWNFALVTIPFPFTYDLGDKDHRNQSRANTHEPQGQLLLRYLDDVAKQTNHPELSKVPIVDWMEQAGPRYLRTLYDRSVRNACSPGPTPSPPFYEAKRLPTFPTKCPLPTVGKSTTEKSAKEAGKRVPHHKLRSVFDDLSSNASTYGFKHGIYSKFHFFTSFSTVASRPGCPR